MNTPSNVMAESQPRAEAIAPVDISTARRFYWLVVRELWENRSIYLAPLIVAAVFLAGFLIGLVRLPDRVRAALALGPMQQHQAIEQPFLFVALILMFVEILVAIFYCLDALYGERRDRSILFWKSVPVSDLETVLSKATIPILVLPLVTCAVTVATQSVMLVVSSAVLGGSGLDATTVWNHVPFVKTALTNLVHLVMIDGIWYAPFYGWLLLCPRGRSVFRFSGRRSRRSPSASSRRWRSTRRTSPCCAGIQTSRAAPTPGRPRAECPWRCWPHKRRSNSSRPRDSGSCSALTALFLYLAVRLRRVRGLI